ncbi:CAP domain-containing protein [Rhodobacter sp. SGA-6-6]|uniref:CAP domain-containing protein n=1 Tax=Rhodobacter sp. SGA-6-6 TaxID=2710882 RepID=UPI0013ED8A58|nr:CAP domain-containing protein [Rhodobacter sp. SGA-6-6]NGM44188.1 CAP domain-containing protein [Rhodobacter sp. SGA-6-6]
MKALFGAVFMVTVVMTGGAALACSQPAGAAGIEADLAGWINAERTKKGLSKLGNSGSLKKAALAHACDMIKRGFFSHEGPGGPNLQKRLRTAGYSYKAAVENIAKSSAGGAEPAKRLWRKSSGHWNNVLNRKIDEMGVAVATDGTSVFYVFVGGRN